MASAPVTTGGASAAGTGRARPRRVGAVLLWELEKLTAQLRTRIAFAVCLIGPFAFALAVRVTGTVPADTLFGRYVLDSGYALPLVVLGFAAAWGFPALICLVAGDIFASEDRYDTWKTVLTRGRSRGELFVAKILATAVYGLLMMIVLAGASLAAGLTIIGDQPMIGVSGNVIGGGHAVGLVLLAWATAAAPVLGFGALGIVISIATRNSLVGIAGPVVLGLIMQFATLVDRVQPLPQLLLGTHLLAWHGIFAAPSFHRPIGYDLAVSGVYLFTALAAAWVLMRRRDFTGSAG